ncbi:MAG: MSMEG_1061 family FMN-dependent PPOX-type flavoprotein [Rhizomicrobium sp.]|jgi:PPOX class probable FMN-dependent enzyme
MAEIKTVDALRAIMGEPNRLTRMKIRDVLDDQAQAFIAASPFLLLATSCADGSLEVSPKGDEPGFVSTENERSLLVPDRAGNNLAFGLTNILGNPQVALIFLSPGTGETLRVSGTATLHDDVSLCERLSARGRAAKLVIRVAVTRSYFHCARSVLRANLWAPDAWHEPMKVSFGRIIADATAGGAEMAEQIDARVSDGYRTGL